MTRMSDFINKISDTYGDSPAVTFYRARTCHYMMMKLCHYDNVKIYIPMPAWVSLNPSECQDFSAINNVGCKAMSSSYNDMSLPCKCYS